MTLNYQKILFVREDTMNALSHRFKPTKAGTKKLKYWKINLLKSSNLPCIVDEMSWRNVHWRLLPALVAHGPGRVDDAPVGGSRDAVVGPPLVPVCGNGNAKNDPNDKNGRNYFPNHFHFEGILRDVTVEMQLWHCSCNSEALCSRVKLLLLLVSSDNRYNVQLFLGGNTNV